MALLAGLAYCTKPFREWIHVWWTTSVILEKGTLTILLLLSLIFGFVVYLICRRSYRKLLERVALENLTSWDRFDIGFIRMDARKFGKHPLIADDKDAVVLPSRTEQIQRGLTKQ